MGKQVFEPLAFWTTKGWLREGLRRLPHKEGQQMRVEKAEAHVCPAATRRGCGWMKEVDYVSRHVEEKAGRQQKAKNEKR